jgi:hypothetical protein
MKKKNTHKKRTFNLLDFHYSVSHSLTLNSELNNEKYHKQKKNILGFSQYQSANNGWGSK